MLKTLSNFCVNSFIQNCIKTPVKHTRLLSPRFLSIMKIGTHDGVFHCDEVLACYMLKRLPQYTDAEIIRTRDLSKLAECDIVVDVGAVFDHDKKRYDHHQREFTETLSSLKPELGEKYQIKLSSAGLVYTYYGEEVIKTLAPKEVPLTPEDLTIIYKKIYENFIQEIDAIDNGVPITDDEPRYKIRTDLSNRVARLNPEWNSKQTVDINEIFKQAMDLVSHEFVHNVNYHISVWLPARDFVKNSIENRFEVHKSGQILEFTERFPWKEHLFDLETELNMGDTLFLWTSPVLGEYKRYQSHQLVLLLGNHSTNRGGVSGTSFSAIWRESKGVSSVTAVDLLAGIKHGMALLIWL